MSKRDRFAGRVSIDPDAPVMPAAQPRPVQVVPDPAPEPPAPVEEAAPPPVEDAQPEPAPPSPAPPRQRRAPAAPVPATEGPGIIAGRSYYRSFYVDDETFARYRAAIYWLARRPDLVGEVPENMSADMDAHMAKVAASLERRFNDGQVFPAPPEPKRRKKK